MSPSWLLIVGIGVALSACAPSAPSESVDSLLVHPAQLDALTQDCRLRRADATESTCAIGAQAERKRFMGEARARYTPHLVELAPALPPKE